MRRALRFSVVLCVFLAAAPAGAEEALIPPGDAAQGTAHELDIGDRRVRYTVRRPLDRDESGALATARRLHAHLARGDIEAAALLSNTPKRRYEVYKEYLESVGEEEFRKVFAQYLAPASRVLAEIAIGPQRLLIWQLDGLPAPTGEFFIEIEGRTYMDDRPSETRRQLRRILERYRAAPAHP